MRLLSNLHVKGKPADFPDLAIRSQSHYFIYTPCMSNDISLALLGYYFSKYGLV